MCLEMLCLVGILYNSCLMIILNLELNNSWYLKRASGVISSVYLSLMLHFFICVLLIKFKTEKAFDLFDEKCILLRTFYTYFSKQTLLCNILKIRKKMMKIGTIVGCYD